MTRTQWIISVLNDSSNTDISIANKDWLRKNVEKLQINVDIHDCLINVFDIAEDWNKNGTILIQNGTAIHFKGDFNPLKEALLISKYSKSSPYEVYLYSPKQFENIE